MLRDEADLKVDPKHCSSILSHLDAMRKREEHCDCVLIVGKFYVDKFYVDDFYVDKFYVDKFYVGKFYVDCLTGYYNGMIDPK